MGFLRADQSSYVLAQLLFWRLCTDSNQMRVLMKDLPCR